MILKLLEQQALTEHMKQQSDRGFIKHPNLPAGEVATVAVSADASQAIKKLNSLGIETIPIYMNALLPTPVASHADLQLLHLTENRFLAPTEHLFLGELQKKINIQVTKRNLGNKYPDDVLLNCKIVGNNIILNKRTIAQEVLGFANEQGLNIIDVKQGYAGCSICAVNESAIITDDESIFTAAQNFLNDVLLIRKGSIRLKGYNYGFIGGCCGKISNTKLAVNGRIESHSDYKRIMDFTNKYNIEIVELTDDQITDIGGIIPISEKLHQL